MISQMNDFLLITSTLKTMYGTDYPFRCFGLKTGIIYGRGNPSPTKSGSRFSEFFTGRRGRRPLLLYNFSFGSIRRYVEGAVPYDYIFLIEKIGNKNDFFRICGENNQFLHNIILYDCKNVEIMIQ